MIQKIGNKLIDAFHYAALFGISSTIVWTAIHDYMAMMKSGHATLEDILLLFIYLELGAMVSTYFKTHRLPVQYVIYIAITITRIAIVNAAFSVTAVVGAVIAVVGVAE